MRTFYKGGTEYLSVCLTADIELTTDIAFSFDRITWLPAAWTGPVGKTRTARVLMNDSNLPNGGVYTVYVRFNDYPEVPVLNAGQITVLAEVVPDVWVQTGTSIPSGAVVGQYLFDTSTGELYLIGA